MLEGHDGVAKLKWEGLQHRKYRAEPRRPKNITNQMMSEIVDRLEMLIGRRGVVN